MSAKHAALTERQGKYTTELGLGKMWSIWRESYELGYCSTAIYRRKFISTPKQVKVAEATETSVLAVKNVKL